MFVGFFVCRLTLCNADQRVLRQYAHALSRALVCLKAARLSNDIRQIAPPLASATWSNTLDATQPLCRYDLLGVCNDPTCVEQHPRDYTLDREMLINDIAFMTADDGAAFTCTELIDPPAVVHSPPRAAARMFWQWHQHTRRTWRTVVPLEPRPLKRDPRSVDAILMF